MKRFVIAVTAFAFLIVPAFAQVAPVKQDVSSAMNPDKLTINDCLIVLNGLNALDGHSVIINAGKPNETVITQSYEFGNGSLRGDIAENIALLTAIQKTSQEAQQKIFNDVAKGETEIKPGTPKAIEYDRQLKELIGRPCLAPIKKIKFGDLKLDKNEIPSSVLATLDKIREK